MKKEYIRRKNMFALWICSLLVPVIVIITGRMMWKHYPKNINGLIGYRTTLSMRNIDTWKFANEYCGRLWYRTGLLMLIFSIIICLLFFKASYNTAFMASLILIAIQCIILVATIFPTENALKREFPEEETRR